MKCPKCQVYGWKSRVIEGVSERTLVFIPTVYDEDGKRVLSAPNRTTTRYSCTKGHHWTEKS